MTYKRVEIREYTAEISKARLAELVNKHHEETDLGMSLFEIAYAEAFHEELINHFPIDNEYGLDSIYNLLPDIEMDLSNNMAIITAYSAEIYEYEYDDETLSKDCIGCSNQIDNYNIYKYDSIKFWASQFKSADHHMVIEIKLDVLVPDGTDISRLIEALSNCRLNKCKSLHAELGTDVSEWYKYNGSQETRDILNGIAEF